MVQMEDADGGVGLIIFILQQEVLYTLVLFRLENIRYHKSTVSIYINIFN